VEKTILMQGMTDLVLDDATLCGTGDFPVLANANYAKNDSHSWSLQDRFFTIRGKGRFLGDVLLYNAFHVNIDGVEFGGALRFSFVSEVRLYNSRFTGNEGVVITMGSNNFIMQGLIAECKNSAVVMDATADEYDYVIGKEPVRVISALGSSSDRNDIMDITHLGIEFEDGVIGHITDSWITPRKHVQLLVRGTKATAILDDTLPDHKLTVYDNFTADNTKNINLDYLEIEPLKLECQHFISCCESGKKARSDGDNGFMVTKVLEEAEKVMLGERAKKLDEVDFGLSRVKQHL